MLEWIRDPINAAAVQAISAAFQAFGALVLIGVTWVTVQETRKISRETERQAKATSRAVELAQEQRRDTVRPVLVPELRGIGRSGPDVLAEPNTILFELWVKNVGVGPAFAVRIALGNGIPLRPTGSAPPERMRAGKVEAPPAVLAENQEFGIEYQVGGAEGNAWLDQLRENQAIGELILTCRDSLNGARTTRSKITTGRRLGQDRTYLLQLSSAVFE